VNLDGFRTFGYTQEDVDNGVNVFQMVLPEEHDRLKKNMGRLVKGEEIGGNEYTMVTKDGTAFPALIHSAITTLPGGRRGFRSIIIDITERKQMEEQLRTMSIVDELTGLYNRRGFMALCQQQMLVAQRAMKCAALFFFDLDHMKWINDALGHQEGDKALADIAAVLKGSFRKSDIVGRMGGDEFAVFAVDAAEEERGETLERLRGTLDSRNESGARKYRLSVSVGVAHFNAENPTSLEELIGRADNLMYENKRKKSSEEH
jgi:diguanylate cyclase (GGDEF)-like protein/PAS domain S-box-containing protein